MHDVGYHCHDSYMDRICCEDPGSFVVSFQRFFRGDDFTSHRRAIRTGRRKQLEVFPPEVEVMMLDLAACSGEAGEDVKSVYRGPDDSRTVKLMAIALDGTRYFRLNDGLGSSNKLCRSSGDGEEHTPLTPLYTFPGNLVPLDCLFVGSSLFMVVGNDGNELWILELERDGTERRMQRLGDLPGEAVMVRGRMWATTFLGLDDSQEALWLLTPKCLVTLQLSSLEVHVCCLSSDLIKGDPSAEDGEASLSSRGIVLNPTTRELLLHFDASLLFGFIGENEHGREVSATCFLRCLKPEQVETERKEPKEPKEWEVVYPEKAELVCSEMFTIDGFSDAFCISRCHVVRLASTGSDSMRLLALDAEGGLWQMEL